MQPKPENFDPLIDTPPARFIIGIDLGTTNSAVTYIDAEESPWKIRVLLIPQQVSASETESLDTLPSFYYQPTTAASDSLPDQNIPGQNIPNQKLSAAAYPYFVGSFARDETAKTSGRGIASAKSWLCHSAIDRTAALLPWHGADDVQRLSPLDVSAAYLDHIRLAWDDRFPSHPLAEQDIILTLPASFDEVARELTVAAAAMAGLPRVVLIEEPQAAFYAWVYKHNSDWDARIEVGQKVLVCDIGGGTTDFSLIRVRRNEEPTQKENDPQPEADEHRIQFHRVAVGNHLILGGDNLDLAIAKYIERKLTPDGRLAPYQWDVLVGTSRQIKEQLLSDSKTETINVSLPSRGSKLVGGSLQTQVDRTEIENLILNGFLPTVPLNAKPQQHQSGFQEFGLPYASDAAITRYLAQFLTTHAEAGAAHPRVINDNAAQSPLEDQETIKVETENARPDVVLFNGGFFASPILRSRIIDQIAQWFQTSEQPDWHPKILENDRLDLAVARGAAYYGMVRRGQGVRIAATLARSYYIGIGGEPAQAICIMPGSAEPGQTFTLDQRTFQLTLAQPVEFSLFVSSIRLADRPGQIIDVVPEQLTVLPPIRTVLRTKSRNEKRDVSVQIKIGLTEIGTIDLACYELDSDRSWKLQFDVRSTTQTDLAEHHGSGESQGVWDESLWQDIEPVIASVFSDSNENVARSDSVSPSVTPRTLVQELTNMIGDDRDQWPMSLLRRIWESLMEFEVGRRRSAQHESRWLNLLGYSLRPGYGVALDDWRVTETWRTVHSKLVFGSANIRNESLILWRRLAGGLTGGQQLALADPWLSALRILHKQMSGKNVKANTVQLRPEDSVEVWRLLGSLELLPTAQKRELGDMIVALKDKPKLSKARDAMIWALGRLGQRRPVYGPLNTVLLPSDVSPWIQAVIQQRTHIRLEHLAVVQMTRRTDDRYLDIEPGLRDTVLQWLVSENANDHLVELIRAVGQFDTEEQGRVFGESLPPGLRLE